MLLYLCGVTDDERRTGQRHHHWFPIKLDFNADEPSLAVTHDVSSGGMLVATARVAVVGEEVTVAFKVRPGDETERIVRGKIVRIEENAADPNGLWPQRMAVEFEEPQPDLEPILKTLMD